MQNVFVFALFFSPAAMASYGDTFTETHLAILSVVALLLLIKAKVR
jgi:hypothetical protein